MTVLWWCLLTFSEMENGHRSPMPVAFDSAVRCQPRGWRGNLLHITQFHFATSFYGFSLDFSLASSREAHGKLQNLVTANNEVTRINPCVHAAFRPFLR